MNYKAETHLITTYEHRAYAAILQETSEEKHHALPPSSQATKITLSRVLDSPSVKCFSSLEDSVRTMCYKSYHL